jgi:hypothetical protein
METTIKLVEILASIDWLSFSVLFLIFILLFVLIKINGSKSSKFFYDDLFLDNEGKASTSKLANLLALILSSWAFVYITIKGNLSETFFTAYMGIWVLNRAISKYTDTSKSDQKSVDPNSTIDIDKY